ncbi:MAG TPA: hypothetical protein VGN04_06190 [Herbaspirillum sp.]
MDKGVRLSAVYFINLMPAKERGIVQRHIEDIESLRAMARTNVDLYEIRIDSRLGLNEFLLQVMHDARHHQGRYVTFHIDAHSNEQGIEVNHILIGWIEFFTILRAVNIALHGRLTLHLAACRAAWSITQIDITKATPFIALIAPEVDLSAGESIEIYHTFYDAIFFERSYSAAVKALKREAQAHNIAFFTATANRHFWDGAAAYVENHTRGRGRQERLENLVSRLNDAGLDGVSMRKKIKALLWADQEPLLKKFWEIFMLIDRYPELQDEMRLAMPHQLFTAAP